MNIVLKAVEAVSLRMVKHSKNYNEALRKEFSDLKKLGLLKGLFNIYVSLAYFYFLNLTNTQMFLQ